MPIELKFTGEVAQLLTSMQATQRALMGQIDTLGKVAQSGRRSGTEMENAFSTGLSWANRLAGGMLGAGGLVAAWRLLKAEIAAVHKVQSEAAAAQLGTNTSFQTLIANMSSQTPATIRDVLSKVPRVARETGVEQRYIAEALAQTISAAGGNVPVALQGVTLAARMQPHAPGAIAETAGALTDLVGLMRGDVQAAHGYLLAVGEMSRVVDPHRQATNLPKALVGVAGLGATPIESGAFVAALTNAMKDISGEGAGTAAISFAKELRELLPDLPGFAARLAAVQADPKLAKVFLEGGRLAGRTVAAASFEAKARAPLEALVRDPQSELATLYRSYLPQFGDQAALVARSQRAIGNLQLSPFETIAAGQREFSSTIDAALLKRGDALAATVRKELGRVLTATGESALMSKLQGLRFEASTDLGRGDALGAAEQILRGRVHTLTTPRPIMRNTPGGAAFVPGSWDTQTIDPTPEERENAELLRELADGLRQLKESLDRNTVSTDKNSRAAPQIGLRDVTADDRE